MAHADALTAAVEIGTRLVSSAHEDGAACNWEIARVDPNRSDGAALRTLASETLYQGTSGIALFLAELWGATGEPVFLRFAEKGLRFSEHRSVQRPSVRPGLHSGDVGIAFAAARLAELSRKSEWYEFALCRLAGIESIAVDEMETDVISGAAGAILGLLRIEHQLGSPRWIRDAACRFGEQLVVAARRRPLGWSWDPGEGRALQDLTGYAHGAAGMAHAFLELYAHTGDLRWCFAAERTLAYESHLEINQSGDWPDFRDSVTSMAVSRGETDSLRTRIRNGTMPRRVGQNLPVRTWCHGAPGIALSRIRASALAVDRERSDAELERALFATQRSIAGARGTESQSLCHGTFGNAEAVLLAFRQLGMGDPIIVDSMIGSALERHGNGRKPWISGAAETAYDPSLMIGESGIGHFLLRYADATVPSVLCISNFYGEPATVTGDKSQMRKDEIRTILPTFTHAVVNLREAAPQRAKLHVLARSELPIDVALRTLNADVAADESEVSVALRDAIAVDTAILVEQNTFVDFSEQYHAQLVQPSFAEIDWSTARVSLAPHARLMQRRWSWAAWHTKGGIRPEETEEFVVVFRTQQSVVGRVLTALQAVIFTQLENPTPLSEIESVVIASIEPDADVMAEIPGYISGVIANALSAGFVVVHAE